MCYEVKCSTCSKSSWGGCGRHVPSVYKQIPDGQHCQCKAWPGVQPQSGATATTTTTAAANEDGSSGICSIA